MIPQKAVIETQGRYSVYVVSDSNTVASKQVTTFDEYGSFIIIREGLNEGDKVVVEGIQRIRTGMEIAPMDITDSLLVDLKEY